MGLFDLLGRFAGFGNNSFGGNQGPWSRTDPYGGNQYGGRGYGGGLGTSGLGPVDPSVFQDLRNAYGAAGVIASGGQPFRPDASFIRTVDNGRRFNDALGVLPRAVSGVLGGVGGLLQGLGNIFSGGGLQDPYGRGPDVGPWFRGPGFFGSGSGFPGSNGLAQDRFETRISGFAGQTSVGLEGVFPPQRNAALAALSDVVSGVRSALREPLRRDPNSFAIPSISIDGRGNVNIKLAFQSGQEVWENSVTVSVRQRDRQAVYQQIQSQVAPERWRRSQSLSWEGSFGGSGSQLRPSYLAETAGGFGVQSQGVQSPFQLDVQTGAPQILPQLAPTPTAPWRETSDPTYRADWPRSAPGGQQYHTSTPGRNGGLPTYLSQTNTLVKSLFG